VNDKGSVTRWFGHFDEGTDQAAEVIWERFAEKLLRLARKRLAGLPRREADEEDVVLSAMNSFFQGVREGRFPRLSDRHDLWRVLVTITARKAVARRRRHHAQKRGAGAVAGESALARRDGSELLGIDQVLDAEPTPEFAAELAAEREQRLARLGNESLRSVALMKLEGRRTVEIAEHLGITDRSVRRKLTMIREQWSEDPP